MFNSNTGLFFFFPVLPLSGFDTRVLFQPHKIAGELLIVCKSLYTTEIF